MNVCDIMTARPTTISPDATIGKALRTMQEVSCHHLPVISAEKHLVGILSVHDCQQALGKRLTKKSPPINLSLAGVIRVSMAMTPAPIIVEPDTPTHEVARLMLENFIGCLPVMRGETLVGIVTRSDLLMAFMALSQRSIHQPYP
ncbi:MAG: CBS domain-containing protein [Chloroflexota bacterium]